MSRRPIRCIRIVAIALVLAASPSLRAAVITVGQPGDPNCHHYSLQSAIDAAAASPGLDIVRVSIGTYPAQRLAINEAGDLAIEGGFVDCANLVRAGTSALDGQGANPPGPVIRHEGGGALTLADLVIRNGNAASANSTNPFGGGVYSSGAGRLTVYRSLIHSNRALSGGGLFVAPASFDQVKQATLSGVRFIDNVATESGGGLYALHANVAITGDDVSYFGGNRAEGDLAGRNGGGAIYARDSDVGIDARMAGNAPFMDGNDGAYGGAIHFRATTPGVHWLWITKRAGGDPPSLGANVARYGGAIYLDSSSAVGDTDVYASLGDAIIENNRAPQGSAVYLRGDSGATSRRNAVSLSMWASHPAAASTRCAIAQRCNRIERNLGEREPIALVATGSGGATRFQMERGLLVGNVATLTGGLVRGNGVVDIDNSVLADNDAGSGPLIYVAGAMPPRLQNSTIAGNLRLHTAVLHAGAASGQVRLHNSIVFQPTVPIFWLGSNASGDPRNLLVGSGHGLGDLVARNIQETADPMFVNPGQGDYRPRLGSPAVNRWQPDGFVAVPEFDITGASRPAPASGAPTPYDYGAHEYGAVIDRIFRNDFENIAD